jgi:3-oxoacyl-[acyl-carrier protein] reductase
MSGLKGKSVIVTGAAGGIGLAICRKFVQQGASVAVVDLKQDAVDNAAELLRVEAAACQGCVPRVLGLAVDVSDPAATVSMAQAVKEAFGSIDCLINNAGIIGDATLDQMSYELFDRVIKVNLYGAFHCAKAVIPYMMEQKSGCIVNATSVVGIYGNYGQTSYVASKAALIGMTKTWAKEYGKFGIRCAAVAPGFIDTQMTSRLPEKVVQQLESKIPMRRRGTADEVADAYVYLCSDQASYLSGIVLEVGGGLVP